MPAACAILREIRIVEVGADMRKPAAFISMSTKPSRPLLNTTIFTGRSSWRSDEQVAHQHGEAAVAGHGNDLPAGMRACAPIACGNALAIEPCMNEPSSRRRPFTCR